MGKYINQRGYALLIVLLTIIIFLSISATFISASLNHVTQEKTVDKSNQAYTAAEMGSKYYSIYFNNEFEKIEQNIKSQIIYPQIEALKACENQTPKGNKCNDDNKIKSELLLINENSLKEFNTQINKLILDFNTEARKEVSKEVTSETVFSPSPITPEILDLDVPVQEFSYSVKGSSNINQAPKTLDSTILIEIPKYVPNSLKETPVSEPLTNVNFIKPANLQNCLPTIELMAPYECELGNTKLIDLIKQLDLALINKQSVSIWTNQINETICPLGICQSDLKGLTIKSDQYQEWDISNDTTKNGNIVFPGKLIIQSVGNHLNLDLIVESLTVKNVLQHIEKNILILGKLDGKGYFESGGNKKDINVSMKAGYKLCLNLDGLDEDSANIKITGSNRGEIVYFSTHNENINQGIKFIGSYNEFLRHCSINIDPINQPTKIPSPNLLKFDFELIVDYFK